MVLNQAGGRFRREIVIFASGTFYVITDHEPYTFLTRTDAVGTACLVQSGCSRYTIGVSQCSDDTWRHKMNDEIQREALFYGGVKVETRTAHDDSRRQIEDIRYFIRQKVDLLIVAANEGMALTRLSRRLSIKEYR